MTVAFAAAAVFWAVAAVAAFVTGHPLAAFVTAATAAAAAGAAWAMQPCRVCDEQRLVFPDTLRSRCGACDDVLIADHPDVALWCDAVEAHVRSHFTNGLPSDVAAALAGYRFRVELEATLRDVDAD